MILGRKLQIHSTTSSNIAYKPSLIATPEQCLLVFIIILTITRVTTTVSCRTTVSLSLPLSTAASTRPTSTLCLGTT